MLRLHWCKRPLEMPHRCCVPNCKGNYDNGPKVSTFAFPKDPELCQRWMHAIKRKNFKPSSCSRVCELHFDANQIEKTTKFYVEATGELLEAPLKTPRLVKDAIPQKLPGCPAYLSKSDESIKESPTSKK